MGDTNTTEQRMLSLALIASLIASSYAATCSVANSQKASEECQADVSAECKTFFESGAECGPIPQKAEDCSCSLDLQNCILGNLTCETEAPAPAPTFNGTAPANPCLDNCLKVCSAQCGDASAVGVSAVAIVAAVAARFF